MLTAVIPAYVAYDIYRKGPAPEKRVEVTNYFYFSPMTDLSALGSKADLSLKIDGRTADNLLISRVSIRNAGSSPILPADYYERLGVAVRPPWKLLAVECDTRSRVRLNWKRLNDNKFEADAALLNPGDVVDLAVYFTNSDGRSALSTENGTNESPLEWSARIVNLSRLDVVSPKKCGSIYPRGSA